MYNVGNATLAIISRKTQLSSIMPPKMKSLAAIFASGDVFVVIANCTSILKPMYVYALCLY